MVRWSEVVRRAESCSPSGGRGRDGRGEEERATKEGRINVWGRGGEGRGGEREREPRRKEKLMYGKFSCYERTYCGNERESSGTLGEKEVPNQRAS